MNSAINNLVNQVGSQKETEAQQAARAQREEFTLRVNRLIGLLGDVWGELSPHAQLRIENTGREAYPVYSVELPGYTPFEIRLDQKDGVTLAYSPQYARRNTTLSFSPSALDGRAGEIPAAAVQRAFAEFLWRDQESRRQQAEYERVNRFRSKLERLRNDRGYLRPDLAAEEVAELRQLAPECETQIAAVYAEWRVRSQRAAQEHAARQEREAAEKAAAERRRRRRQVALDRHEASLEAWRLTEERNAERLAPLQTELDGPFTAYVLTYSTVGRSDEDGERFLETETVLCLSDQPDNDGYYRTVRNGRVGEERFAFPVRMERIAGARWSERSQAARLLVREAGYDFTLSFSPELDRATVKARVAACDLEPLPELLPHPNEFDFDTEEFDA